MDQSKKTLRRRKQMPLCQGKCKNGRNIGPEFAVDIPEQCETNRPLSSIYILSLSRPYQGRHSDETVCQQVRDSVHKTVNKLCFGKGNMPRVH
jgi:hypothetical protein